MSEENTQEIEMQNQEAAMTTDTSATEGREEDRAARSKGKTYFRKIADLGSKPIYSGFLKQFSRTLVCNSHLVFHYPNVHKRFYSAAA